MLRVSTEAGATAVAQIPPKEIPLIKALIGCYTLNPRVNMPQIETMSLDEMEMPP